jgi:hypothetical protein
MPEDTRHAPEPGTDPDEPASGGGTNGPTLGRSRADEPRFPEVDSDEDTGDQAVDVTPPDVGEELGDTPRDRAHHDLLELADRFRTDASHAGDPRLHALLESSAEVLVGLAKAFADHPDAQTHAGSTSDE